MATTQDNRLLAIHTPLGKDFLLLDRISGTEGISKLFSYDVQLLHAEEEAGFKPTRVDPASIVGQGVTVTVAQRDGTARQISGIVNRFSQGHRNARFSFYSATIVPHVWILTQRFQSRIFQNISVVDILRQIFADFNVSWQIQGLTEPRNYCVQYRESDFDFASRLMEEEGIFYYFEHSGAQHKMVLANTSQSHADCPGKSAIPYSLDVTRDREDFISSIHSWRPGCRLQTGKVTLWDYHFQIPTRTLDDEQTSIYTLGDNRKLEFYDHPGGYARKYDSIDRSGGEQSQNLSLVDRDKTATVQRMVEALDSRVNVVEGSGDCSAMTAGFRFRLFNHPENAENIQYAITSVSLQAEQNPTYVSDDFVEEPFSNTFSCIAVGAGAPTFRPARETPKPVVRGSQTAVVVGPAGEEIFTDKFGRVKVQFHWDRHGQGDAGSSCWIRVVQPWAGNRWGAFFVPRIGMEVVVDFLEGDPDQPMITGCVYNPTTMPPYTLPDEKSKMTIKSDSTKGGGGFNELRFEDKKGSEQIFIHAEKNQDVRIKNDALEFIGHDRHLIVKNEQFERVDKDKHLVVKGDQNEKVDGSISVKAGMDIEKKAGTKYTVDAGTEIHLKSGTTLTIETGTSLTLKVGGNFIYINAGGIFIKGTMVMLNSGGAAGSGSGSNPDPPKEAKEADTADPGQRPQAPQRKSPPQRPVFTSPAALVLENAAETGTAFCEICTR